MWPTSDKGLHVYPKSQLYVSKSRDDKIVNKRKQTSKQLRYFANILKMPKSKPLRVSSRLQYCFAIFVSFWSTHQLLVT